MSFTRPYPTALTLGCRQLGKEGSGSPHHRNRTCLYATPYLFCCAIYFLRSIHQFDLLELLSRLLLRVCNDPTHTCICRVFAANAFLYCTYSTFNLLSRPFCFFMNASFLSPFFRFLLLYTLLSFFLSLRAPPFLFIIACIRNLFFQICCLSDHQMIQMLLSHLFSIFVLKHF